VPILSRHGDGFDRDRQHIGANLLREGLGEEASFEAEESALEFKPGGGDLKTKLLTHPPWT